MVAAERSSRRRALNYPRLAGGGRLWRGTAFVKEEEAVSGGMTHDFLQEWDQDGA
ncbi:hypothetical protein MHYP_G00236750 [Metynnis hypsauchen]